MADQTQTPETPGPARELANAVKLLADTTVLPGASLMVDGNINSGLGYAATGLAAKIGLGLLGGPLIGTLGFVLVGLNSYSQSVAHKNILQSNPKV